MSDTRFFWLMGVLHLILAQGADGWGMTALLVVAMGLLVVSLAHAAGEAVTDVQRRRAERRARG